MTKLHPWAMSDGEALCAQLDKFCDEAGGIMRLFLVRDNDRAMLRKAVLAADPLAITLAAAVGTAVKGIEAAPQPFQCLLCDCPFAAGLLPAAFMVWLPGAKTPDLLQHEQVVTQPICVVCSEATDRALLEHALAELQRLLPGAEELEGSYEER
jgi:hypothetical protein